MKKIKSLIKFVAVASVMLGLAAPAYANVKADSCQLDHTCELPAGKMIYVPFTDKEGASYVCSIRSKEQEKDIIVVFTNGRDFEFPTETKKVGVEGTDVHINGKFTRMPADGEIKMSNTSLNDGLAGCKKA